MAEAAVAPEILSGRNEPRAKAEPKRQVTEIDAINSTPSLRRHDLQIHPAAKRGR